MEKIFLILIFVLTARLLFAQSNLSPTKLNIKELPTAFEYFSGPDSIGENAFFKAASTNNSGFEVKLPYPIIFIHGLAGN